MYDHDKDKRIPQGRNSKETPNYSLLEEASDVARRVLGTIQAVAGTTTCKGVQIHALHQYAVEHNLMIDVSTLGTFADRGSENEVYMSFNDKVYKLNDFRYSDDNLEAFFERIRVHNTYFPDCAYELVGFAYNQTGKFCAVLSQPFIQSLREATEEEIASVLMKMGFKSYLDGEYFSNGDYEIFDALPNNVLVGKDGHLFFIDTIIYTSQKDNIKKYRSLSPRYKS